MTFYLGTHMTGWLETLNVPLFVSHRRLMKRTRLPRALGPWALDSGGFTELKMHGRWTIDAASYARAALRYAAEVGRLAWAAIQDWMCEPFMLEKTGKGVAEHQALSVESFLTLSALAPAVPWVPVLQGWRIDDYLGHAEQYRKAGIDLSTAPVVGVGSVCRRQATDEAAQLFAELAALALPLHGFGLKIDGLKRASAYLASSDSMAWSSRARKQRIRLDGCPHATCANCPRYALLWRRKVLKAAARPCQNRMTWGTVA